MLHVCLHGGRSRRACPVVHVEGRGHLAGTSPLPLLHPGEQSHVAGLGTLFTCSTTSLAQTSIFFLKYSWNFFVCIFRFGAGEVNYDIWWFLVITWPYKHFKWLFGIKSWKCKKLWCEYVCIVYAYMYGICTYLCIYVHDACVCV